jgi:methylmalonyl-CoA mutase C-terminal domain/subunit
MTLFPRVVEVLKERDAPDIVVFGGGIIPAEDIVALKKAGLSEIFTPGTPLATVVTWVNENIADR